MKANYKRRWLGSRNRKKTVGGILMTPSGPVYISNTERFHIMMDKHLQDLDRIIEGL